MESAERKRARNACQRCRARKGKCTADSAFPCSSCLAAGAPCFVVKRKQRPSHAERSCMPLGKASDTGKRRASTTTNEKPKNTRNSTTPKHQAIIIPEDTLPPTNTIQESFVNWDPNPAARQSCAAFSSPKLPAEAAHDARVDPIVQNLPDPAAFDTNLRLSSWLMICPIPLQDSIKEGLASVMSEKKYKSPKLPSLVLQALDAICIRVKELHPSLADGYHHPASDGQCPCGPKVDICTAHRQCQNSSRANKRRQDNMLARCERLLELSLRVYDTVNKGNTQNLGQGSSPICGGSSVTSPQTMSPSPLFDEHQPFLDSFLSKHIQPDQLLGQTTINRDDCSGEGPLDSLDSLLTDLEWTAR